MTVNFDDPGTYHLYYGDGQGRPGTILTFFPRPQDAKGRNGPGQATIVAFAIPIEGLQFWAERLEDFKISYEGPIARFGDRVFDFPGPRGAADRVGRPARLEWRGRPIWERAGEIRRAQRVCGVTLAQEDLGPTEQMLTGLLGFRALDQASNRYRYITGNQGEESFVDVLVMPGMLPGRVAVGTIHHVAWRTPTDHAQWDWREGILRTGTRVTPVQDRQYFRSIYFHEPGGILFEIATDPPGFTVDESLEQLGTRLMLPPWLEPQRLAIEQTLPPLRLPEQRLTPIKAIG